MCTCFQRVLGSEIELAVFHRHKNICKYEQMFFVARYNDGDTMVRYMTNTNEWEKSLKDIFDFEIRYAKQRGWKNMANKLEGSRDVIKSFISSTLQTQRERIYKELLETIDSLQKGSESDKIRYLRKGIEGILNR